MKMFNLSYDDVFIKHKKEETIIYCDPPYRNTEGYQINYRAKEKGFDYETFYKWCIEKKREGYNIFISELNMPEEYFQPIFSKKTLHTISQSNPNTAIEKLFIPK